MELLDAINQRKTIKAFDREATISRETLSEIINQAQKAPSKANLQPWRFVVVDDKAIKNELSNHVAFNTLPCETASALILVLADLRYELALDDILDKEVAENCLAQGFRDNKYNFLLGVHNNATPESVRDQVLIDTSLASMQLMLVAKDKGFDTHAIGIFDREKVLEILSVNAERYTPVMLIALGKPAAEPLKSSRLPVDYTVSWNDGKGLK
ncbi:nitroreductase [Pasteurellaceae bacterium RH1A]|nr:nitroreductase [Pasteurellaceae bacterium RH1A]